MTEIQGLNENKTFMCSSPVWANACVGDNGNPSYYEYAKGFADSAFILIEELVKDEGVKYSIDHLIYPIAFNLRHAVELRIKHQILLLDRVRPEIPKVKYKAENQHDINNIWGVFKTKALGIDSRYDELVNEIEEYIKDIGNIDSTGQTFRYPMSNESQKHLVEVGNINVLQIRDRFIFLSDKLEELHKLSQYLIEEYSFGTYSKSLSRVDIFELAEKLPVYDVWASELAIAKEKIKADLNIGSHEFGHCLVLIKNHYDLSKRIELFLPLKSVTLDELLVFFECLALMYSLEDYLPRPIEIISSGDIDLGKAQELLSNRNLACDVCFDEISPAGFVDIYSIYEFGRYTLFSEYYTRIYEDEKRGIVLLESDPSEYRARLSHLLSKTNAYQLVLGGLLALNQFNILRSLNEEFNLAPYFDFIEPALEGKEDSND